MAIIKCSREGCEGRREDNVVLCPYAPKGTIYFIDSSTFWHDGEGCPLLGATP